MCYCMGLINVSSTKIDCLISLSETVYVMQLFIINSESKCNPFIFKHFSRCNSKAGQAEMDNLHGIFHLRYMANLVFCLIFSWRLVDPNHRTKKKLLHKSEITHFKTHPSLSKSVANLHMDLPYALKMQYIFRC